MIPHQMPAACTGAAFNPLHHPVILSPPRRLTTHSAWQEHIPFAMGLVDLLRPAVFVELGTHWGDSYCAFCQAVAELKSETRCYAVDTWQGDPHSHSYGADAGAEVLADLRTHHDPLYGNFSRLLQSTFDDALTHFTDGTIDLLHIDGWHTYEAVKHDFESWLPKMSARGIVLFHDTAATHRDFAVIKFWEEIKQQYPHFEFSHGHGLGVLAVGQEPPPAIHEILAVAPAEAAILRQFFSHLGQSLVVKEDLRRLRESRTWRTLQQVRRVAVQLRLRPP